MALFGRRKPVVQIEIVPSDDQLEDRERDREREKETRRRNRLSKPLTNSKVSTSASTTSLQESVTKSRNPSTSELVASCPLSSHPSNPDLRKQIRTEVFDLDRLSPQDALKSSSTLSVAQMIRQFDKDATSTEGSQESSLTVNKPKKRKSLLLRRFSAQNSSSLSRSASKEHVNPTNVEPGALSPNSSLDRIAGSPSIPPTRRASFTPGAATRKPSVPLVSDELKHKQEAIKEAEERSLVGLEYFDWQPRPPTMTGRAGTPADLSYSHLAGLRIGSLQVMNGRASPAFSEISKISKHLLAVPRQLRDVSSEYGDAEDGTHEAPLIKDDPFVVDTPDAVTEFRNFSWESVIVDCEETTDLQAELDMRTKIPLDMDDDQASMMAKEYMAELPPSPFSLTRSSSLPGSLRRFRSSGSLQKTPSMTSLQKTPSMMSLQRSPSPALAQHCDASSPVSFRTVSSLSPSGSVVRRPNLRLATVPDPSTQTAERDDQPRGSVMSWYSPVEPSFTQNEPFQSALEFQIQKSPTRVQPQTNLDKSDSGYSSNNSLRSLRMAKMASAVPQTLPAPLVVARPPEQELQTMSSELQHRPSILRSRKTEPTVPTFANLRPTVMSMSTAPPIQSPVDASVKPVKQRKKLQKKRTRSQPSDKIAITRVRSFEADTIPAIPLAVEENLRIRTQEVPELEQTYNRLNAQASSSTMHLPMNDIRFPSPKPQQTAQVQRSRSISRPRSWISRSKEEDSKSRRVSDLSQSDALAIINDFSTAASSLGNSPYTIAHENFVSDPLMGVNNSYMISSKPKSMMDDRTAAAVAKFRRRSLQQREALSEKRPSFNDRGGIPGKALRPASFISEAPPITKEMLQTVYRTSSMQRQTSVDDRPAPPAPSHPPPPPPPPHSPRPAYVDYQEDYQDNYDQGYGEDYSDLAVGPPPPSHSPRPVDITPGPGDAQAATWKARRQSLGLALSEQARYSQRAEEAMYHDEEPLYPDIPPRNEPGRTGWPQFSTSPEVYSPPRQPQYDSYQQYQPAYYPDYDPPRGREYYQENTGSSGYYYHEFPANDEETGRGRSSTSQGHVHGRQLPEPRIGETQYHSRPHSQAPSLRSQASSLAEELHPEYLDRPNPPPEFGRYSGGMGFGYERGNGFGGSAGTRSVSGKAEATRKGVPLRAGYGVDLGDVPVLGMVRV